VISVPHAEELIKVWLTTDYLGGRHEPRLEKLSLLEERNLAEGLEK
jgi:ribose 5-phosphate isomerase RpiB